MTANSTTASDSHLILAPPNPAPGAIAAIARQSRTAELGALEKERKLRIWRVRGFLAHHVDLWGGPETALGSAGQRALHVDGSPLIFHLHFGGRNAIIFDLVADADGRAHYIEVRVETALPSDAMLLARRPLNELLDILARNWKLPLVLQRLELLSPLDGDVLVTEVTMLASEGLKLGPLGGFHQVPRFAAYDAIYREALVSSSPFYRLLCAFRLYEGTQELRKWLRGLSEKYGVSERMPPDPRVDPKDLTDAGMTGDWISNVRNAGALFDKFRNHRDAIAHFLIDGDAGASHVYIAEGAALQEYSVTSAVLLPYAQAAISDLRGYYQRHFSDRFSRGSVYPEIEHRDRYVVRDPQVESPRA